MTHTFGHRAEDDTAEIPTSQGADVDLGADPFDDDLAEQLAERAPRQVATRTTLVLGALALLVAGFVGGAQVQKHWGTSSSTQTSNPFTNLGGFPQSGASGFPGAGFGPNSGGSGSNGATVTGNSTTGTVKLVDGTTVYIQTADDQTVTVKTGSTTTVKVTQTGSLSDIKAGSTVTVQGQTRSDGTVSATSITRTK